MTRASGFEPERAARRGPSSDTRILSTGAAGIGGSAQRRRRTGATTSPSVPRPPELPSVRVSDRGRLSKLLLFIAFGALAIGLSRSAYCCGAFARPFFRWLLVVPTQPHLAIYAFALQLLLQDAK